MPRYAQNRNQNEYIFLFRMLVYMATMNVFK